MGDYALFLFWIFNLYCISWHHTVCRRESELIKVNNKLANILFYMRHEYRMSVVSIIIGLFAHISIILFLFLVIFKDIVQPYMRLLLFFWFVVSCFFISVGLTIETFIKRKRAETKMDKAWSSKGMITMEFIIMGCMLYLVIRYVLLLREALMLR